MLAVKKGGNRQELHEAIRQYLVFDCCDFVQAVLNDRRFGLNKSEMERLTSLEKLVGAAPQQVDEFLRIFGEEEE